MKKVLLNSILDFTTQLEKLAAKIAGEFDVEDIHHFRTTAKKLRSLLRWQKQHKNTLPSSFVKDYHITGELRNMQLLLIRFNEEKIVLPHFMVWITNEIARLQRDWIRNKKKKSLKKLSRKLLGLKWSRLSRTSLETFFQEKMDALHIILQLPEPPDDQLHEIRKIIKDIYYTRQWCKKHWKAGWEASAKFSLAPLDKLSDQAGNYNDESTGLLLLTHYLRDEKDRKALKAAAAVRQKLEREKQDSRIKLIDSIRHFVKRV